MALKSKTLPRIFEYNGKNLPDPNPNMTPGEVMNFYANKHPELTSGKIQGPDIKDEQAVYNMSTSVGVKG